jgi:hypothetical protein
MADLAVASFIRRSFMQSGCIINRDKNEIHLDRFDHIIMLILYGGGAE